MYLEIVRQHELHKERGIAGIRWLHRRVEQCSPLVWCTKKTVSNRWTTKVVHTHVYLRIGQESKARYIYTEETRCFFFHFFFRESGCWYQLMVGRNDQMHSALDLQCLPHSRGLQSIGPLLSALRRGYLPCRTSLVVIEWVIFDVALVREVGSISWI